MDRTIFDAACPSCSACEDAVVCPLAAACPVNLYLGGVTAVDSQGLHSAVTPASVLA